MGTHVATMCCSSASLDVWLLAVWRSGELASTSKSPPTPNTAFCPGCFCDGQPHRADLAPSPHEIQKVSHSKDGDRHRASCRRFDQGSELRREEPPPHPITVPSTRRTTDTGETAIAAVREKGPWYKPSCTPDPDILPLWIDLESNSTWPLGPSCACVTCSVKLSLLHLICPWVPLIVLKPICYHINTFLRIIAFLHQQSQPIINRDTNLPRRHGQPSNVFLVILELGFSVASVPGLWASMLRAGEGRLGREVLATWVISRAMA